MNSLHSSIKKKKRRRKKVSVSHSYGGTYVPMLPSWKNMPACILLLKAATTAFEMKSTMAAYICPAYCPCQTLDEAAPMMYACIWHEIPRSVCAPTQLKRMENSCGAPASDASNEQGNRRRRKGGEHILLIWWPQNCTHPTRPPQYSKAGPVQSTALLREE